MEEISVCVLHSPDHPSLHPWFAATMSALPLETRIMALFHRGPHHTESTAKENSSEAPGFPGLWQKGSRQICPQGERSSKTRSSKTRWSQGSHCWNMLGGCTLESAYPHDPLSFSGDILGSLGLQGDSVGVTDPGSTFQAAF